MPDPDTDLIRVVKKGLSYGTPKLSASASDPGRLYKGTIASDFVYIGEPPFAPPKVWSRIVQAAMALAIVLAYYATGMDSPTAIGRWIAGHQITSGLFLLVCLPVAVCVGSVRQVFNKLMATAGAMELIDGDGRLFLSYLGDVPPFRWQYSAWPRVKLWMIVALTSVGAAFVGAELIASWWGASREAMFWTILGARWCLSSLLALLCIDGGFWSRMSPPS